MSLLGGTALTTLHLPLLRLLACGVDERSATLAAVHTVLVRGHEDAGAAAVAGALLARPRHLHDGCRSEASSASALAQLHGPHGMLCGSS